MALIGRSSPQKLYQGIINVNPSDDNMNDGYRFSRDHVVECSERTVLSCLEPVCLCWRHFGRYFSHHLVKSDGWLAGFMH